MSDHDELERLIIEKRDELLGIVAKRGHGLLRYESVNDLVQGIQLRALQVADHFEYKGDREFMGWIRRLVDQHISDRHHYWRAQKRRATRLLRITQAHDKSVLNTGVEPAASTPGASVFAMRREALVGAARALAVLLPRDQEIIRMVSEGASIEEIATALETTPAAAERARTRAQERLRKAFLAVGGFGQSR